MVSSPGSRFEHGERAHDDDDHAERDRGEPPRCALAVAHVEQRERHGQRGRGGRLHRGGNAQRQPGGDRVAPSGCQSNAKPKHKNVTMARRCRRRTVRRDDRRGRQQQGPPDAVPGPAIRSAKANTMRNMRRTRPRIGEQAVAESACGTPNGSISGKHGLYWLGLVVSASACELRYGLPLDERRGGAGHDADLGFPVAVGAIQSSGNKMAPQRITPSATSTPGSSVTRGEDGEGGQRVRAGGREAPRRCSESWLNKLTCREQGAGGQPGGEPGPGHGDYGMPPSGLDVPAPPPRPPSLARDASGASLGHAYLTRGTLGCSSSARAIGRHPRG